MNQIVDGYLAVVLDKASQARLLEKFPPSHSKVFAHHVTVAFKPTIEFFNEYKKYIGRPAILNVFGYAKDENGEAMTTPPNA